MGLRLSSAGAILALVVLAACVGPSVQDLELDMKVERDDNYRAVVRGMKCGACKAVTSEIAKQYEKLRYQLQSSSGGEAKQVFGAKYMSEFDRSLQRELTSMCNKGQMATRWGLSQDGSDTIINATKTIDRFGRNMTKGETNKIQQAVYGIGLFTDKKDDFWKVDLPEEAENPDSVNYSMNSKTFVRTQLEDACERVIDAEEFEQELLKAKKDKAGFDVTRQHVTCINLEYCKVVNDKMEEQRDARVRNRRMKKEHAERKKHEKKIKKQADKKKKAKKSAEEL